MKHPPPIGEHGRNLARYRPDPDPQKINRIILETGEPAPIGHATAGGDERRLRGIPTVGRHVGGAIRGTRPHVDGIR